MTAINSEEVDYDSLPKLKKLAIFLIVIGPERAAEILQSFNERTVTAICKEIAKIRMVDRSLKEKVLDEFSDVINVSLNSILGGTNFTKLALGNTSASRGILGELELPKDDAGVIRMINEIDAYQIFNLIKNEQTQTIAFLLSYLSALKASQVIKMLSEDLRLDVIEKMGYMRDSSPELMARLGQIFKKHQRGAKKYTLQDKGGVESVAEIINSIDKEMGKALVNSLEARNPELGAAVRKKMFTFEDLTRISVTDLQRIAREVEMSDLVKAMKSASDGLQASIYASVSKRAAEAMKDEMQLLGPIRLKDVEEAQDRVIAIVRKLDEAGEISIDTGGSNVMV